MTEILHQIADIVGPQGLLTGEDVSGRAADFMGLSHVQAKAIVRPASTAELSAVMKLCHAAGQTVVPAGGYTGLVHGADCQPDRPGGGRASVHAWHRSVASHPVPTNASPV